MHLPATRLFTRAFWSSLDRPCGFWISVAAFLVLSSFASHAARAQAADLCASAGGTAECTGPQVGPYEYQIFRSGWTTGPVGSEEAALDLLRDAFDVWGACTMSI